MFTKICTRCDQDQPEDEYLSIRGKRLNTCQSCRNKQKAYVKPKCQHSKNPDRCIQCHGKYICEHSKLKYHCGICGYKPYH